MKRKCFVFDLDGTLLNSEKEISSRNLEALERANKQGHVLIIATGRNYFESQFSLKKHWGLFNYFIGCNGAIIYSIRSRQLVAENNKINFDFVEEIMLKAREEEALVQVATEWNIFIDSYQVDTFKTHSHSLDPIKSIQNMNESEKSSILQASIRISESKIRKFWKELNQKYQDEYEITITSAVNIDINIKGTGKFFGVRQIINLEEILYENIFIFGDSQNDIQALKYYNNTFAMGNALQEAKDSAKYIIGNNNSNSIAKIILKNID